MTGIGRLIHLNGPPGAGKTSLARRYLADHPLALVVDIDDLRMNLGQWAAREESRLLARELAIALVDCHLSAGHDVVVPQFLGRLPFIERLAATNPLPPQHHTVRGCREHAQVSHPAPRIGHGRSECESQNGASQPVPRPHRPVPRGASLTVGWRHSQTNVPLRPWTTNEPESSIDC